MGLSGSLGGSGYAGAYSGAAVHQFDSGLHQAQRTEIRTAVIDRIDGALGNGAGYVRLVAALPRPLKGDSEEEIGLVVDRLQGQAPAVLVALGRKTYEPMGTDITEAHYRAEIEVCVYAVSSNLRERTAGRMAIDVAGAADPKADPGLEIMLEHLEQLLLGQTLNLESTYELRPESEDELATFADLTIWEQRYRVKVDREINPFRSVADVLVEIEAKNNLDDADAVNPVVDVVTTLDPP